MKNKKVIITIDKDRCKGCMLCIKVCARKVIKAAGKVNKKGQQYVYVAQPEECIGCGLCFMMCPDLAIEINKQAKKDS